MAAVEEVVGKRSPGEGRCETAASAASTASEAREDVVEYIMLRRGMEQRFRWIPVEDWEEELVEDMFLSWGGDW